MNELLVALAVVGGVVLLALIWLVVTYNRFIHLRQHIKESWADIDVELKRRYELIPNLVETVKGYAKHEREVLQSIIALRNRAAEKHENAASQGVDESALAHGLSRLFALVESYPDLKANQNFLALQKELALTEDRIGAARRFYNANVREMNQLRGMFPTSIVAQMFGFAEASFFELDSDAERVVPRVELG